MRGCGSAALCVTLCRSASSLVHSCPPSPALRTATLTSPNAPLFFLRGFPGGTTGKEPACQRSRCQRWGSVPWEDPLEEALATHSSILAWRIPWPEEPGGLQCVGWQRVGHD